MEHWQKVTIGTLGGLVATVIFYLIVGRLLDYFYIRNKKRRYSENVARPERFYSKKRGSIKVKLKFNNDNASGLIQR